MKVNKLILISISLLIVGGGLFFIFKNKPLGASVVSLKVDEHDIILGNDSAQLTVFMYSSYQCSFCRKFFNEVLPKLKDEYIDNNIIRFVIKSIDLAPSAMSHNALKTVTCVTKYGNIEKLHELLLLDPTVAYTREFEQVTEEFIEKDPFIAECMLNGEAENYLNITDSIFWQLGLTGTPAFVIDQKAYKGYHNFDEFNKIIEKELRRTLW